MSSQRQAILSLVLSLGSSFLVTRQQSLRAEEPAYQNRTVSSWLQDFAIGRFPDMEKDAAAVKDRAGGPARVDRPAAHGCQ